MLATTTTAIWISHDLHDLPIPTRSIIPANGVATPLDPYIVSKHLHYTHHDRLVVYDSFKPFDTMVRRAPSLASFFSRSSIRVPSDPTSNFLLDPDPFAKLDSPMNQSPDISIMDSPSYFAPQLIHSSHSSRSPLSPCQLQSHGDDFRPPSVSRTPFVDTKPLPPSIAHTGDSFYASTITLKSINPAASKCVPADPWDIIQPSEDGYGPFELTSRFSSIEDSEPPEFHQLQPHSALERECPSPDTSSTTEMTSTHPCYNGDESDYRELECQELAREFPWLLAGPDIWDIVHDVKDVMESQGHLESSVPEQQCNQNGNGPIMHEAPWGQGQGYRGAIQRGGGQDGREDDTPSDYDQSDDYGSDANQGHGHGGHGKGNGNGNGGGHDDDDDDEGPPCSAFSDEEEESASDSDRSEDSEDDVPIAQRIPGAIQAQKSIRIKDKAERERKRRERNTRRQPRGARAATAPTHPQAREVPLAVDDLTKRLLQVQTAQPHQGATLKAARSVHRSPVSGASSQPRHVSIEQHDSPGEVSANSASLSRRATGTRSRRQSVSQPGPQSATPPGLPPPPPVPSAFSLSRSTTAHRHHMSNNAPQLPPQQRFQPQELLSPQDQHLSQAERRSYEAQSRLQPTWRRSHDTQSQSQSHQDAKFHRSTDPPEEREVAVARARTLSSAVAHAPRVLQRARTTAASPPAPLPPMPRPQEVKHQGRNVTATQHRVFVGDMQRFNTVEIDQHTRARDVIDLVDAQGELWGDAAAQPGGWMLWELAQDFGMERPLREYELPAEIYASWNSNTRLNAFMIKKTPLAPLLAQRAMPSSSPRCSGYVQWESKRGKWTKRWMELREHSLWLSKRDTGKDETFMCSLSNFDCYYVSRLHKAPRPFVFAVKSTDNLTLFENPADYLHIFSCDQKQGQQWMEHILLARSYVLHKERTVLFGPSSFSPPSAATPSFNPSHKSPPSRSAGPLVNANTLQAPSGPLMTKAPFQSGSLLAKKP